MSEPDTAAVIALANYNVLDNLVGLTTKILIVYEFLVTLDTEVRLFWGRQITGASVVFFVNRYTMLFYAVYTLLSNLPVFSSPSVCIPAWYIEIILEFLNYIPWAAFSALRVFALTGGNWFLAPVVFVLSLGPIIINLATLHWELISYDPVYGCSEEVLPMSTTLNTERVLPLSIPISVLSRGPLIIADIIVIVVTWVTTYKMVTLSRSVLNHNQPTFAGLLLRDGTLYFTVMLSMNVLQLAFLTRPVLRSLLDGFALIPAFTEPLSSILISRFMMNLQEARRCTSGSTEASWNVSRLRFERVIGSIGETLESRIAEHASNDNMAEE